MEIEHNPNGSMARFAFGLVQDIWKLGNSRQTAGEIAGLAELLCRGTAASKSVGENEPLFCVLPATKFLMLEVLASRPAVSPSDFTLHWGTPAGVVEPHPAKASFPAPPDSSTAGQSVTDVAVPVPQKVRPVPDTGYSQPVLDPSLANAMIDLADWLQKAAEDERISPKRAIETARRKADSLLALVKIDRIDGDGSVDVEVQEVVDSVSTHDAAMDMRIATTVEFGYRIGDDLIRPQRVLVYRYSPGASASETERATTVDVQKGL